MERALGGAIPALYAANTLGAVLGALGAAFLLIPLLGLRATTIVCAAANFACALMALRVFRAGTPTVDARTPSTMAGNARLALGTLAITGLLGIGYEVLVVRALSQVAENTVYTFAILLAIYLVGTSIGALAYTRWRGADAARLRDALLATLAFACLVGVGVLAGAAPFKAWAAPHTFAAALGVEILLALGAFLPATVCMGALFSHLATQATRAGTPFARCLGVNTLGAAAAPLVAAALMISGAGMKTVLLGLAAAYLLPATARAWTRPGHLSVAAAIAVAAWWLPSPARTTVPDGGRVVRTIEGPLATVSIVADADEVATLHIDNKQQEGSSATVFADGRQGVLPLLLHPDPRRALFLGLGTGVTSRAASAEVRVDAVELLPQVIDAASYFEPSLPAARPPRLIAADARRYVRDAHERYDVIVADNFHPARSGSGTLYTLEHFRAVRDRLADDGVFCQWLPLHQLDLATLRSIVRSYLAVYPHAGALLATNSLETPTLGLVSRRDGARFDVRGLRAHLARPASARLAARFGFPDELAVLGSFIADAESLGRFAGTAPLNTDDRPVVAYSAPRITYAPESSPRERLFALLDAVDVAPAQVAANAPDAFDGRLAAYWSARDRYLQAGRDVRPTPDVRAMVSQVRGPLIEVLHLSPDFRPAYDPLLGMAAALSRVDPDAARDLLRQLADVSPDRPEASSALIELGATHR
jgi:spermidine synthase